MTAWDAGAASLVKIVEWRSHESVIVVGSVGQVESQIHSPAAAECNAASLRRDIATALRSAHAAGRAEALAEVVRHLRSAGLPVADFIERGDHLRTWAVKS